jgi:hypothetical protein
VFECAESRGVPIYLHPQIPPKPAVDTYYGGFAPDVSSFLSIAGCSWHIETGVHCIRLIMGGTGFLRCRSSWAINSKYWPGRRGGWTMVSA